MSDSKPLIFLERSSKMPPKRKLTFYGAGKKYLEDNFQLPADKTTDSILNGHVFLLYIQNGNSQTKTDRKIRELYEVPSTTGHVYSLVKKCHEWARNIIRPVNRQRFEDFCKKPYVCTISSKPSKKKQSIEINEDPVLIPADESDPASAATIEIYSTVAVCKNTCADLPRSSRGKLTAREIQLKKRLSFLSEQIANSSRNHRSKIAELKSKLKNMPQKLKVLNQKVKRKNVTIKALKKRIHELKKIVNRKKNQSLKVEKCTSDWKIKHSDQTNSNVIVITNTNTEKTNYLEDECQLQIVEEIV